MVHEKMFNFAQTAMALLLHYSETTQLPTQSYTSCCCIPRIDKILTNWQVSHFCIHPVVPPPPPLIILNYLICLSKNTWPVSKLEKLTKNSLYNSALALGRSLDSSPPPPPPLPLPVLWALIITVQTFVLFWLSMDWNAKLSTCLIIQRC